MKPLKFLGEKSLVFSLILLLLITSYFLISSEYNYVNGDAGAFARHAKILYETNTFDVSGSATSTIGQLLVSNILCHIFGFKLKILHLSVYCISLLYLFAMYLLLCQLGVNSFLAFWGSLALIINPISLKLIDWYITEPFFMFYLIMALYSFCKGFKSNRIAFLYWGGFWAILAILTRQHAISLSIALFILCLLYRKELTKKLFIHSFVSLSLPIVAILLFYLHGYLRHASSGSVPYAYASENIHMIKQLLNPLTLLSRVYFDSIIFLHYAALYVAPLFIILFISFLLHPDKIKKLKINFIILDLSILSVSIGTLFFYFKDKKLMPYRPSIFSISALTRILSFSIMGENVAAVLLTILTCLGGIIILIYLLDHFSFTSNKQNKKQKKEAALKREADETKVDIGKRFIYLWGVIYVLVSIFIGLRYDRYIYPFSIMVIYLILDHFSWIKENKKIFFIIFFIIYSIFMFKIIDVRLTNDLYAYSADYLMNKGIPTTSINGGLGFNHYHNFYYIAEQYKNSKVHYRLNWYKFHPMADYFIQTKKGLEKKHPGLELLQAFSRKRFFGLIERTVYIYKRKEHFRQFIII